jgi:uncharacterized protein YydD (DUF2326 family)
MADLCVQELHSLQGEVRSLQGDVKDLKEQIKELASLIKGNGSKMNQHIDFVENVYTSVRHPLNFVKTKIESLIGRSQNADLPALTQNSDITSSFSEVDTTAEATTSE